jgi:hypothetical protein
MTDRINYWDYIKLDELHRLQSNIQTDKYDEVMFIAIHQHFELWFFQIIRNLDEVIRRLQELTLVVECAVREAAPLLAAPSHGPVADMAAAGLWGIGVHSPAWSVQPTQEGYGGRAVIRVGFKARI